MVYRKIRQSVKTRQSTRPFVLKWKRMDRIEWVLERFGVLVQWRIRHEYYRDGVCRGVELKPDEPTKGLLKRRDVRLKRLGVNVWGLVGPEDVSWDEEDEVGMEVKVKDAYWRYYTEGELPGRLVWRPGEAVEKEVVCRAKRLRWEYVVLMREWRDDCVLELKETEERLVFGKEGETGMNGMRGVRFVSAEAVRLEEKYDYRLRLSERKPLGNKILAKELPFPLPGRFPECGEGYIRSVVVI